MVFATEDEEMFDEPPGVRHHRSLPAVAENRAVYTDETLAGAIYFDTPLSLEYALDRLTPMLELAAAGESPRAFPGLTRPRMTPTSPRSTMNPTRRRFSPACPPWPSPRRSSPAVTTAAVRRTARRPARSRAPRRARSR